MQAKVNTLHTDTLDGRTRRRGTYVCASAAQREEGGGRPWATVWKDLVGIMLSERVRQREIPQTSHKCGISKRQTPEIESRGVVTKGWRWGKWGDVGIKVPVMK